MTKEGTLISPFFTWRFFSREQEKKRMWLGGDVVSVSRQPIKLLFSLFARTNSPSVANGLSILVTKTLILFKSAGYHAFGFNEIRPRIQYQSRIISQQWDATYVNHLLQYNYFQFSTYKLFSIHCHRLRHYRYWALNPLTLYQLLPR